MLLQYNTIQHNCNLIEPALQSSQKHIEAGQSLGFSSSKVWHTLGGGVWDLLQKEGVKIGKNNSVTYLYFMDGRPHAGKW